MKKNLEQLQSQSQKKKKKKPNIAHNIGFMGIGGFPGHEHVHPTGEQLCLKCGRNLEDIIKNKVVNCTEKRIKDYFQTNLVSKVAKEGIDV